MINDWQKENTKQVLLKLNTATDADILKHLADKNKQGYIKALIRKDMEERGIRYEHETRRNVRRRESKESKE